jgi:hypothetical protein
MSWDAFGETMIALPLFFQMTLEHNTLEAGLPLAPLSLTMFATALVAGRGPATGLAPRSSAPACALELDGVFRPNASVSAWSRPTISS